MRSPETAASPRPEASAARAIPASYKWWIVFMLWFVCFFNYADRQSISAVFPEFEREFGFNKEQLGLIGSAFMWVYAGGALFAGLVVDRFPRKHLILGGCLFWSFITMTTAWCTQIGSWSPVRQLGGWLAGSGPVIEASLGAFGALVLVRALEGFGETFYFPASMSLTSDYHSPKTRSRALSFHQSSVYAGTILGSWLGAWLAMHYGWRVGFYLFGGAGMALAFLLYRFLREPDRGEADRSCRGNEAEDPSPVSHPPLNETQRAPTGKGPLTPSLSPSEGERVSRPGGSEGAVQGAKAPAFSVTPLSIPATFRAIFRSPAAVLLMLAFVCANGVATVFLVWTPSFLKDKFHYDLATAGLSGTVFIHTASFLAVPVAGWLADRASRRFAGGRILVQAAGLLGGAAFVFLVGNTDSRTTLIVAMTIFGLCKGFYDSGIFASLYDSIEPRARGTAAGIMNTVGWGGGAFGPWFVGRIAEHGSKPTKIENMSDAISWGGWLYLLGAVLLAGAVLCARRDSKRLSSFVLRPAP